MDCVAAGDMFNGAFVVALAEGMGVTDAIGFAQRAAGISVTRHGAQSSVPFRRELVCRGGFAAVFACLRGHFPAEKIFYDLRLDLRCVCYNGCELGVIPAPTDFEMSYAVEKAVMS